MTSTYKVIGTTSYIDPKDVLKVYSTNVLLLDGTELILDEGGWRQWILAHKGNEEYDRMYADILKSVKRCKDGMGAPTENGVPTDDAPVDGKDIQSLDDAIVRLKVVARFNSDLDHVSTLLWAAHCYMRGTLPDSVCLYLAFKSKMSSGKTTVLNAASVLAHKGVLREAITDSAMKRIMTEGCTLCIDELDAHIEKDPNLATTIRVGNKWNATASLCIKDGNGWKPEDMPVGGPKCFTLRGELEEALRSRTIEIGLPMAMDIDLIANSFFVAKRIEPIKHWLEQTVASKIKSGNWTPEKVETLMMSDSFHERVKKIKAELPRNWQQAFILLAVSDIMDWKLDKKIKSILESQEYDDPYEQEKDIIADYCYEFLQRNWKKDVNDRVWIEAIPLVVRNLDLENYLDERLHHIGKKKPSRNQFATLKREIGWIDKVNQKKDSSKNGNQMLSLDKAVLTKLGLWDKFEPYYTKLGEPYPRNTNGQIPMVPPSQIDEYTHDTQHTEERTEVGGEDNEPS